MSSLHDKPQLAWVEAVAFVNGLRLASRHSPYNGIILFYAYWKLHRQQILHTNELVQTSTYGVVVIKTIKIIAVNLHSSVHKPHKKTTETRGKKFSTKIHWM